MVARVRLKMQCGIATTLPFVFLAIVCGVDIVYGMFEHRHCNHQHPRVHEVSFYAKGDSNLFSLQSTLTVRHAGTDLPSFSLKFSDSFHLGSSSASILSLFRST